MTFSSPPKRRPVHSRTSSPDPGLLLLDHLGPQDRNTESSHNVALQGKAEHHREVQEAAIAVLNDQRAQLEISKKEQLILQMRLRAQQEEHRLRIEQAAAAEQARLNALKAASIKKPPPLPPSPAARTTPPPQPRQDAAVREVISTETQTSPGITSHPIGATNGFSQPQGQPPAQSTTASRIPPAPQVQPAAQASRSEPPQPPTNSAPTQSPFDKPPAFKPIPPSQPAAAKQATPAADEVDLRYLQIHKSLKKLRMWMVQQASGSPAMKNQLGDMRREIRKCVGQLVPGSNAQQTTKIVAILKQSISGGEASSIVIDPSEFIVDRREALPAAALPNPASLNQDRIPGLFLYLLNIFSKAIIKQFANECGADPKRAEPIGIVAALVFSKWEFHWRGKSMIDILLAKFRVACPVLFGKRGSDATVEGRRRVGWLSDGPRDWIPEQLHFDRMTGLGAGFGALSLRDFSRSSNKNPYPPSNYWTSFAAIVNTPAEEISGTQCVVLRAMIQYHQTRFLLFYGSAARAALRYALRDFPAKARERAAALGKEPSAAVGALQVLESMLRKDVGLVV